MYRTEIVTRNSLTRKLYKKIETFSFVEILSQFEACFFYKLYLSLDKTLLMNDIFPCLSVSTTWSMKSVSNSTELKKI